MASLDTRRPAAMEQLAILGVQVGVDTLPIVPGPGPGRHRQARQAAGDARRLRRGHARHRRPPAHRRRPDGRGRRGPRRHRSPHETLLVVDGLTGQDAVNVAERVRRPDRHHRRRAHPHGRRRPRRRRALDARRHRQADQVRRPRREARRAGGIPPRAHRRPHPRHGRHRRPRREGAGDHRGRAGRAHDEAVPEGSVQHERPQGPAPADAEDGRHVRRHGHAARHGQDAEADGRGRPRRQDAAPPDRAHQLDDQEGAPQSRAAPGQPQAPHRRRRRASRCRS